MADEPENLPAPLTIEYVVPDTFELTIPEPLQADDTLKQAKHADVQVANDMLGLCYAAIPMARSIQSLCKLIDTSLKTIEVRRKVLNLEYGHPDKGPSSAFTPLED